MTKPKSIKVTPPAAPAYVPRTDHIVTMTNAKCHCGQTGSRRRRCKKCFAVIARCGSHYQDIERDTREHCKP